MNYECGSHAKSLTTKKGGGMEKLLEVMGKFMTFMMVMVSRVYTYVQTLQIVDIKCVFYAATVLQ